MTPVERIADFAERLSQTTLAEKNPLRGCTDDEIAELERRNSIQLPATYREFLKHMGHCAAGIGVGSYPEDLLYDEVLLRTEYIRATCDRLNKNLPSKIAARKFDQKVSRFLGRLGFPSSPVYMPDEAGYSIPDDILFINQNDVETAYWAIKCDNPVDSPVYTFDEEWELESTVQFESLCDFLELILVESLTWHEERKKWRED